MCDAVKRYTGEGGATAKVLTLSVPTFATQMLAHQMPRHFGLEPTVNTPSTAPSAPTQLCDAVTVSVRNPNVRAIEAIPCGAMPTVNVGGLRHRSLVA